MTIYREQDNIQGTGPHTGNRTIPREQDNI